MTESNPTQETKAPITLWFGSNEEHGDFDVDEAIERELRDRYDDPGPWTLTEYATHPPEHHLPWADSVIEWIVEQGAENETDEGWWDQATEVSKAPEVVAAAEALLTAIAARITYRMASKEIATHELSRTADGKVLLDGVEVDYDD